MMGDGDVRRKKMGSLAFGKPLFAYQVHSVGQGGTCPRSGSPPVSVLDASLKHHGTHAQHIASSCTLLADVICCLSVTSGTMHS